MVRMGKWGTVVLVCTMVRTTDTTPYLAPNHLTIWTWRRKTLMRGSGLLLFIQRRTSLQINTTWVGRDRIPWRLGAAGKEDGKKPIGSSHCIISLRSRLGLFHPLVSDDATCYASMGVCTKTWSICRAHSPRFFRCQTQKYGHLLHIFAPRLFGKIDTIQVLMSCEGKYWHIT